MRQNCQNLFNALGITVGDFFRVLNDGGLRIVEANGNNNVFIEYYLSASTDTQIEIRDYLRKNFLDPDTATVDAVFKKIGVGLDAFVFRGTSVVFIKSSAVVTPQLIAHEILHILINKNDVQIEALMSPIFGAGVGISSGFAEACLY